RVPYLFPEPGASEIGDTIRSRRGNGQLLELDGVVLNSEPLAKAWNEVGLALRDFNTIPADMREVLILRCAVLNNAAFEWIQHEPIARSLGLTTAQLLEIRLLPPLTSSSSSPSPSSLLPPALLAAIAFADYSTKEVKVPKAVFDALRGHLKGDREMVEAVATVAGYNMVGRVLVALDVGGMEGVDVPIPK
ncbi:carboxymuconolactone decarboxylase, partial [Cristinia sonorae]